MAESVACKHLKVDASVSVDRIEDVGRFIAHVRIACAECKTPFQFSGLRLGLDIEGATMSADGQEAHLAMVSAGSVSTPPDSEAVRGFRVVPRGNH